MEFYPIIKAIHIIFVVSYFAGLFYIVRLFIYHTETQDKPETEQNILRSQFRMMEKRLWNIITVPAGILVLVSGITMLSINSALLSQPWMHIKLTTILLLVGYHLWSYKTIKEIQKDVFKMKSVKLRMMNEVATLLLFIIVFAVILKGGIIAHWYWILISFVAMGVLIMLIVRLVNRDK
jgi:putative membrane protein